MHPVAFFFKTVSAEWILLCLFVLLATPSFSSSWKAGKYAATGFNGMLSSPKTFLTGFFVANMEFTRIWITFQQQAPSSNRATLNKQDFGEKYAYFDSKKPSSEHFKRKLNEESRFFF